MYGEDVWTHSVKNKHRSTSATTAIATLPVNGGGNLARYSPTPGDAEEEDEDDEESQHSSTSTE